MRKPASAPTPVDPGDDYVSGWRYRAVIYSIALAMAGYLAISLWGGWREVLSAAQSVGLAGLAIALALSLVNYGLRFLRWQSFLSAMGHPIAWPPSLGIYVAGFALTTTPGKAGEMVRGVLLRRRGVPYSVSFAAFFSERLSDLLAVVLLTLIGVSTYPPARPIVAGGVVLVMVALAFLGNADAARRLSTTVPVGSRLGRVLHHGLEVLDRARQCHSPLLLLSATVLSVVAWGAEAWAFHLILQWMGVDVSLTFAIFVYAVSMLAGALSFMPGGLGGAEAVMVGLLLWKGVGSADAIAATMLIRLATLWFAVGLGIIASVLRR